MSAKLVLRSISHLLELDLGVLHDKLTDHGSILTSVFDRKVNGITFNEVKKFINGLWVEEVNTFH